jgi:hypothetical protein
VRASRCPIRAILLAGCPLSCVWRSNRAEVLKINVEQIVPISEKRKTAGKR